MMTFARFLQLPRDEMDLLGLVGLLQDIGKVKTPDSILNKKGGLSAEELKQARLHVAHSAAMLRDAHGLPQRLADLVLLHHERYDGSGYPRRLAGPGIGMMGCMAAIVDGFSAMTSIRPYAEQMSPSNALGMLYKERGTRYHEALVEQFIQCIGIYPVGSLVQLNSGEIGVVIAQNRVRRLQPRVMVLLDAASKPIMPQTVLDLIKEPKSPTGEPYRIRRTIESGKLPLDPHDFFL
jgi:HD-GYP domain-containing protein (c-di-GMP phosphodiesterase class II)